MPNSMFRLLSSNIKQKNGGGNIQQISFAYTYLILISFLYKYAHFVDIDNKTYIQNSDVKEILGYSRTTKSVDKIIKKNGVLDELGITLTTKDFPTTFTKDSQNGINKIPLREFTHISEFENHCNYNIIKSIVKNKNYEVKEPIFLTQGLDGVGEYGTLYEIGNTHQVTIDEILHLFFNTKTCPIDVMLYFYFKSKCKGFKYDMRPIPLDKILAEIGIEKKTFYNHVASLKDKKYIIVNHKGWKANISESELNEYIWKGLTQKVS